MTLERRLWAALLGTVLIGCGTGSETGMAASPQGQGGMQASLGTAATGATWAAVVAGAAGAGGAAGIGNPPLSGGTGASGFDGAGAGGVSGASPTGGASGFGVPTGGSSGAGGMGGEAASGGGGAGGTPMTGDATPTIPAVSGECPSFVDGTITFMGLSGIQIIAGAKPATATAPMVFYWHGTLSSAGEFALMASDVAAGVRDEGGVLVSFQNTTGGDLLSGTFIFGESDFALTDQLAACAVQNHNVDPRRIFATGCSAGGLFSAAMAARRSSYLAAAAPNSGGWTVPVMFETDYTPALMTVHGLAGLDVVAVDFSVTSATADMAFKNRGGFVINCDHGGGHCGGGPLAGDIWQFFKAHPYGVKPSPWTTLPAGFNPACEIF